MQSGYLLRNRYRIERLLSESGGFGKTYIAIDEDFPGKPRRVVKHIQPQSNDPEELKLDKKAFESEAMALAMLGEKTDRIPTLYSYFEEGGDFYLVQEFIEGKTLTEEIRNRKLSEAETLEILQEILIGLEEVHAGNKIHRDLKPDNIIRRAKDNKLVLIDFGAVKKAVQHGSNLQISQTIGIGTKGYMPFEQGLGEPKFASDIYAVGAIALQCLTGVRPSNLLDENTYQFTWRHLCQVSTPMDNLLSKMVELMPANRYSNAKEAKKALDRLITPVSPPPVQPKPTAQTVTPQLSPFNSSPSTTKINRPVKTAAPPIPVINSSQPAQPVKSPVQSVTVPTVSRRVTPVGLGLMSLGVVSLICYALPAPRVLAPKSINPSPEALTSAIPIKNIKITEATQIGFLERKLQRDLNQNWQDRKQIKQAANFIVNVDQDGQITNYQASEGTNSSQSSLTPLPQISTNSLNSNTSIGSFRVVFTSTGIVEITPAYILDGDKSLGKPITEPQLKTALLEQLKTKLQSTLVNMKPINVQNLNYRVAVTKTGEIADYEPTDRHAYEYEAKTPLPRLTKFNPQAAMSQEPLAQYNVVFRATGEILVTPK
jgi:serine/threonine protein kinase